MRLSDCLPLCLCTCFVLPCLWMSLSLCFCDKGLTPFESPQSPGFLLHGFPGSGGDPFRKCPRHPLNEAPGPVKNSGDPLGESEQCWQLLRASFRIAGVTGTYGAHNEHRTSTKIPLKREPVLQTSTSYMYDHGDNGRVLRMSAWETYVLP